MSERTYDGSKVLGELSGLGTTEVKKIWEQVKANELVLRACAVPHDFGPVANDRQCECSKCHGTLHATDVHWYNLGLEHGRKTP